MFSDYLSVEETQEQKASNNKVIDEEKEAVVWFEFVHENTRGDPYSFGLSFGIDVW